MEGCYFNRTRNMNASAAERTVRIWDLPTRIFHWLLLALVVVCWFTGEEEGGAALIHRISGEAIAGLLVFRLIWGFTGGEHARFSDFAAGPSVIFAHVRDLLSGNAKRHLGHNPLGGLAVFLLLLTTAGIVITGLFSGEERLAGPFAGMGGLELSELHEVLFRILQGLIIIHILGVIAETLLSKDALVPAMITGRKKRRADESASDASSGSAGALAVAAALGFATTATLMMLPSPQLSARDNGHAGEHSESDEVEE